MPPGHNLLLAACRVALGTARPEDLAPAASGVADWSGVLDAAERHAVLPLLHAALAAADESVRQQVPPAVAGDLARRFDGNALHNVALAGHLAGLAACLTSAGVAFMPIKGPSLTVAAYGDLSLRQFADLDLVVHRRDLDRIRALLGDHGYVPLNDVPDALDHVLLGSDYHVALHNPATGVFLEVHWALGRRGLGALRREDWPWTHAATVTVVGRPLPALEPAALIVYLCVHGVKHNWAQLVRVCDVYAAIRSHPDTDAGAVRRLARRSGVGRMVDVGLGLCDALLGANLRERGWAPNASPVVQSLIGEAAARCLTERNLSPAEEFRLQLGARERVVDRLLFSLDVLSAPHLSDLKAVRLPPQLRALYHVVRPFRLALEHGRRWVARSS